LISHSVRDRQILIGDRQELSGVDLSMAIMTGAVLDCESMEGTLLCGVDLANAKVTRTKHFGAGSIREDISHLDKGQIFVEWI
jgi:uncharacterized protein YjbI with pentapeptide repeats